MVSHGAKQRVRKSAAVAVAFGALGCGMFHLEDWLDQETFCAPIVSTNRQHFAEDAAPWLPLNVDYKINGFRDLGFGVGEGGLRVVTHDQIGEPAERFLRRIGMNCREGTGMAGVEGIEQCSRL